MAIHYRSHRDPKSSHQQISQLVKRLGQSPVLDVGAAQGMLGKSLEGTGIVLDAVDTGAAAPRQEFRIGRHILNQIEHLRRAKLHQRAAFHRSHI